MTVNWSENPRGIGPMTIQETWRYQFLTCRSRTRVPECGNPADVVLLGPDGVMVPTGVECSECADAFISHVLEVMGEEWLTLPIVPYQKRTQTELALG